MAKFRQIWSHCGYYHLPNGDCFYAQKFGNAKVCVLLKMTYYTTLSLSLRHSHTQRWNDTKMRGNMWGNSRWGIVQRESVKVQQRANNKPRYLWTNKHTYIHRHKLEQCAHVGTLFHYTNIRWSIIHTLLILEYISWDQGDDCKKQLIAQNLT